MNPIRTALFIAASLHAALAGEAIWPQFRGVGAAGVADSDFPDHFGPDSNVVWKIAMPGGHSSPCIWKDRIFLVAYRVGRKVQYDPEKDEITGDSEANALLKKTFRDGWTLNG